MNLLDLLEANSELKLLNHINPKDFIIKDLKILNDKNSFKIKDSFRDSIFLLDLNKLPPDFKFKDFLKILGPSNSIGLLNIKENLDDINIPLLSLSKDLSLESHALNILKIINKSQNKIIEENEVINQAFMEMNIKQASISEYIKFVSEIIRANVIYFGKLDHLIYYSKEQFLPESTIENYRSIDQLKYFLQKIERNGQLYGYIVVDIDPQKISEKNKTIIEYSSTMILIKIQNQIAVDNSKEIVRSDLIADICMNNIKSMEEVRFRANLQGWTIEKGLLSVIFDIDEFKHSLLHSNKNIDQLEEEKQFIYKIIIQEMDNIPYPSYYYRKSDSIIFLVNIDLDNNISALDNFIKSYIKPIHDLLKNKDLSYTLTIGIGTYYKDIMQTYKSYNEAVEAINISRVFKEVDDISSYKDVIIFKYLMEIMSKKEYQSIYTNLVKEIISLDHSNKTEYFKTLKCIIKNDWNLKDSSEELFIHYNTIIYRLERLKDMLGMSLDNFYEKFMISLTVMILEVEKHINFNKGMLK